MRMLLAPDSFKGSITSIQQIELLKKVAIKHFPYCEFVEVPIGDGGEGTMDALIHVLGGSYETCFVKNPLGKEIEAKFGKIGKHTAIIEMAQASGLPLIEKDKLNPLKSSSYGTGQLIKYALEKNLNNIYLTIGGSATNDGGIGAISALGVKFLDEFNNEVEPNGENMIKVVKIDDSNLLPEFRNAKITVLCDVNNPLLGPNGATYVYGTQKGASDEMKIQLENGMKNYSNVLENYSKKQLIDIPGSGAAGGLLISLISFANINVCSGMETVLSLMNFEKLLENVDLVISGEGRLDSQSSKGKVLSGLGKVCKKKGIPVVAIVGSKSDGAELIYNHGVNAALTCVDRIISLEEAIERTNEFYVNAADQLFRLIKIGKSL